MIRIIAAMSEDRVIGRDGDLPWHLPCDLQRFKTLTSGHAIIMGRRTWESVGRPLPNRTNIVLTRHSGFNAPGAVVLSDLESALKHPACAETAFIAGGSAVYAAALPLVDQLDLTIVHAHVEGDTYFPEFDATEWTLAEDDRFEADERHAWAYSFRTYRRT